MLEQLEPHAAAVSAAGGAGAWEAGGGAYSAFLFLRDLYASLARGKAGSADAAPPALTHPERLDAADRLAGMLQDAAARWGLGGGGGGKRLDARPGGGAAQQAAYARMSGAPRACGAALASLPARLLCPAASSLLARPPSY